MTMIQHFRENYAKTMPWGWRVARAGFGLFATASVGVIGIAAIFVLTQLTCG